MKQNIVSTTIYVLYILHKLRLLYIWILYVYTIYVHCFIFKPSKVTWILYLCIHYNFVIIISIQQLLPLLNPPPPILTIIHTTLYLKCSVRNQNILLCKDVMQGKLIAVVYTLRTYCNQFSMGGICKQE